MAGGRSSSRVGWIAGILVLMAGPAAQAAGTVVVRAYEPADVSTRTLNLARETAAAILLEAAIDLEWQACGDGSCSQALGPLDLVVRMAAAPADAAAGVLGSSLVDVDQHAGTLATVYLDRIQTVAERNAVEPGTLLGRAIAHEVGHMLLGTAEHRSTGLMRARWVDKEIRRNLASDWLWVGSDVELMHRGIEARRQPSGAEQLAAAFVPVGPVMPTPTSCHVGKCVSR